MPRKTKPDTPLLSRADRYAAGKSLRDRVERTEFADWAPARKRDALAVLTSDNGRRIPDLLPIRYGRMAVSPFTYLRGAASVMAADLAGTPMAGLPVQACGDCHLMNFGAFATPEGRVLFDVNDFDETLPGVDFTVDLRRLAASVAVAALGTGLPDKRAGAVAAATIAAYRLRMHELAAISPVAAWTESVDLTQEVARIADPEVRDWINKRLAQGARNLGGDDNFPKLVAASDGVPRILDRPPLIYHFDTQRSGGNDLRVAEVLAGYHAGLQPERRLLVERYALHDVAFKVVGIGSVGTFCAVGLCLTADGDALFLQIKEALPSVLERIVGPAQDYAGQQGRRVVEGQRMMQTSSDLFLGWTQDSASKRNFYVRQLKNRRLGSIAEFVQDRALGAYAELCGRTLARSHARSGDAAMLAGYMGKSDTLDQALASFALVYAAQTKTDHADLVAAIGRGEITAAPVPA